MAKVDQLMALVDQLETRLPASRAAANLLEAIVAELTAAGSPPPSTPPTKKPSHRPQPVGQAVAE